MESDSNIPDTEQLTEGFQTALAAMADRLGEQLSSVSALYQVGAIAAALVLGWLFAQPTRKSVAARKEAAENSAVARFFENLTLLIPLALGAAFIWASIAIFNGLGQPISLMRIVASLLTAWVGIRLVSSLVSDPFAARVFALFAWTAAALNILHLLAPTIAFLDGLKLPPGGENAVSAFDVLWAIALAAILLWSANFASRIIQGRLNSSSKLTPSVRGLLGQLIQISLVSGAILLALSVAKVNLTGLAVLTGAIGVGIGFGLQSIFSNFIAGIIILLEKTLKVGDFVDLESGITGEVREINVRSTLVTTNDNVDILVPNAEFITNRVTNWTLREVNRRIRVPFGVAYGTDKELVKKAALEAAENVPFTLKNNTKRAPDVWLVGFGDSSLDFELVVWLTDDAVKRPAKVHAAYNWEIETALGKYGIEIPFPQRDLHIIPRKED